MRIFKHSRFKHIRPFVFGGVHLRPAVRRA